MVKRNILLKFIEEPTAKTILLFVAENLERRLPTIQSWAQLFPLKRLQDEEIKNALVERQVPEQKAMQIARLSDGNYHKALYLINHNNDDFFNLTRNRLNAIYQNKGLELMQWHEEITEGSKKLKRIFYSISYNCSNIQYATESLAAPTCHCSRMN